MVNNQLIEYVKQQLSLNVARETITNDLKGGGWSEVDIHDAFEALRLSSMTFSTTTPAQAPAAPHIQQQTITMTTVATPSQPATSTTTVHTSYMMSVEYAGFWRRFTASLVDSSLLGICMVLLVAGLVSIGLKDQSLVQAIPSLLSVLYFAWLESSKWQGTIGKHLMGLKVTDMAGNRLSFMRALARTFSKFVSGFIFCIGFIMVGFTSKKQGLHDMIVGTLVVKEKEARVGLVLLSIFGPMILFFVMATMLVSMISGILGFGLGSFLGDINSFPLGFTQDNFIKSDTSQINLQKPFFTPGLQPRNESSSSFEATKNKVEIDAMLDDLSAEEKSWAISNPSADIGPSKIGVSLSKDASLDIYENPQINVTFPVDVYSKIDPGSNIFIVIDHLYDSTGADVLIDSNTLKDHTYVIYQDFDMRVNRQYYSQLDSLNLKPNEKIIEETFGSIVGSLVFEIPTIDNMIYTKVYPFTIKSEYHKYDTFAKCLDTSGAKFYGASWCSHCATQKEMFGPSAQYLPFVECAKEDGSDGQSKACNQAKIREGYYPTWIFKDGTREEGIQELDVLADKTQCTLPQ